MRLENLYSKFPHSIYSPILKFFGDHFGDDMRFIWKTGSFRRRFGDHVGNGDYFGDGIISEPVQVSSEALELCLL